MDEMGDYGNHIRKAHDLCVRRHRRYGSSNIDQAGILGVVIRMGDKMARLQQFLIDAGITVDMTPDEAQERLNTLYAEDDGENKMESDLLDLINYAVIGRMWLNNEWGGSAEEMYG